MRIFSITEQQVRDNPHLVELMWPERNPELDRTELGRYTITEMHVNFAILIWYAQRDIDDIEVDINTINPEHYNLVNRLYIGRPKPKYTNENNCISTNP